MTAPIPSPCSNAFGDDVAKLDQLEHDIAVEAQTADETGSFPAASIRRLSDAGLLTAPLVFSGRSQDVWSGLKLADLLTRVGRASLTVGRLFEGHVNGSILLYAYGNETNHMVTSAEAAEGRITGVWNAERGAGLVARRRNGGWMLNGEKIFCSGAGSIRCPIVTARVEGGTDVLMMIPNTHSKHVQIDLSKWRPLGMRGTATGSVRFDDLFVPDDLVIGEPGDYYRSPLFSGGAWRVLAVQLGGLQHIVSLHAQCLNDYDREGDVAARIRFTIAAQNLELARLLVNEACRRVYNGSDDAEAIDAYIDSARGAFENLALTIIECTRCNIGLSTYIAPHPLDLVIRDLETYLRQPFLDRSRDNAGRWLLQQKGRFFP